MSRCVYATCGRVGKQLPQGWGFTFCDYHAQKARKILSGRRLPPAERTPSARQSIRWYCDHRQAGWNVRVRHTHGVAYHVCRSCQIGYSRHHKNPDRWDSREHAAEVAYEELKEKHA